jgi:hypothetical protein
LTPTTALDPESALDPNLGVEFPETPAQPDYGTNNRDLPDSLKKAILQAVGEAQSQEKYLRRQEVLQDAMHRTYDAGIQHCYIGSNDCYVQATPGGSYSGPNGPEDFGTYIDDYNIFTAYGEIIRAKLSDPLPEIDFQPDDPNRSEDIEAAAAAENARHEFDRNNNIKAIQQEFIYHLEMGGRAIIWTRTEDKPAPFGVNAAGEPRRQSTATVYGCIESKVPIFANCIAEYPHLILYDDPYVKAAKTQYPWIADKMGAGQTCQNESEYERIARLGIVAQSGAAGLRLGDSIAHLISRGHCWLRLAAFEDMKGVYVDDDGANETSIDPETGEEKQLTIREKIAQLFPDGVHAVVVGKQYAESWNQDMEDCCSVSHAYIGKGQSRMPIMTPMVVVQDRFNSTMNHSAEEFDYNTSETWISCEPAEFASLQKQRASPGALRNLKELPAGTSIEDHIKRLPGGELPASFQNYVQFIQGALPQFQLSVPPSLWGQAMSDQRTATGYQLAASQAMGILGKLWAVEVWALAQMYYHNCIAISQDEKYSEVVTVPGREGRHSAFRKESLFKGNFRAYPDLDSGFPESTNSKRQTIERFTTVIGNTPLGSQMFSSPDNIEFMMRETGLTDMVLPEAEARNKQLREIETLLGQPPILAQPLVMMMAQGAGIPAILKAIGEILAQQAAAAAKEQMVQHAAESIAASAQGQPEPPPPPPPPPPDPSAIAKSSIPVWPSDYHQWEAKKCRDWLSSDDRHKEESIGRPDAITGEAQPNIAGILNVVLHMMEHETMGAMEAPPVSGPLPAAGSPPKVLPVPPGM